MTSKPPTRAGWDGEAAILVPEKALDAVVLAQQIDAVLGQPDAALRMARNALSQGRPDATLRLVALVERLAGPVTVGDTGL